MSDPSEPAQSGDRPPADATTPAILASDAEREQAIERLRAAAAEGRLTLEELADRVESASTARTRDQLAQLARDLPEPAAGGAVAPAPAGGDVVAVPTRNSTVFGDLKRSGGWRLPERSRWDTVFGDVVLDLREAQVAGETLEVRVTTVFGDVELLVPEGVAVEVRTSTTFGDVKQDAGEVAPAGAPRVVLTGWTVFGDVKVRARRLRERLIERWRG